MYNRIFISVPSTGGRKDSFADVQAERDMAWCVSRDEVVSVRCESQLDRSSVANPSSAAAVKHPCKSKFSEKGVFLVDYICFFFGVGLGI